jgi:hypothetical protein
LPKHVKFVTTDGIRCGNRGSRKWGYIKRLQMSSALPYGLISDHEAGERRAYPEFIRRAPPISASSFTAKLPRRASSKCRQMAAQERQAPLHERAVQVGRWR